MEDREGEDRRSVTSPRTSRIVAGVTGGGISMAIVVIVANIYKDGHNGIDMSPELAAAFGVVVSSIISTAAICLHDLKSLFFYYIRNRRKK